MNNPARSKGTVVEVYFDRGNFESYLDVELDFHLSENQWSAIHNALETKLYRAFKVTLEITVGEYARGVYDNPESPTTPEFMSL